MRAMSSLAVVCKLFYSYVNEAWPSIAREHLEKYWPYNMTSVLYVIEHKRELVSDVVGSQVTHEDIPLSVYVKPMFRTTAEMVASQYLTVEQYYLQTCTCIVVELGHTEVHIRRNGAVDVFEICNIFNSRSNEWWDFTQAITEDMYPQMAVYLARARSVLLIIQRIISELVGKIEI